MKRKLKFYYEKMIKELSNTAKFTSCDFSIHYVLTKTEQQSILDIQY